MSLFEEIQQVICEQLKVKPEKVKSEANLIGDLGVDSLDTVELIMALEEKFNIEIPDEDAEKMDTVSDVAKYIENKINRTPKAENK